MGAADAVYGPLLARGAGPWGLAPGFFGTGTAAGALAGAPAASSSSAPSAALAMTLARPAESAFGRTPALWGCSVLIVAVTAAVPCVPDVRDLTRRTTPEPPVAVPSADAEGPVGRLG